MFKLCLFIHFFIFALLGIDFRVTHAKQVLYSRTILQPYLTKYCCFLFKNFILKKLYKIPAGFVFTETSYVSTTLLHFTVSPLFPYQAYKLWFLIKIFPILKEYMNCKQSQEHPLYMPITSLPAQETSYPAEVAFETKRKINTINLAFI